MKHGSKGIYVMDCGEGARVGSRVQPNGVEHGSTMSSRGWSRECLVVGGQRGRGAMVVVVVVVVVVVMGGW